MDIVQLVALAVGILGLVWHQQRIVERLRVELRGEIAQVRGEIAQVRSEFRTEIAELRTEIAELRTEVAANGQRLARIEGYFGIGMSPEAAAAAAGARTHAAASGTAG